jgi:allophanate hydrolase subunit 2
MTHILANRRGMLRATAGLVAASLLGSLSPALAAEIGKVAGRSEKGHSAIPVQTAANRAVSQPYLIRAGREGANDTRLFSALG